MAIGAQGYSIGDAIRTLLGEVLDVKCFKKWLMLDSNGENATAWLYLNYKLHFRWTYS